MYQWLRQFLDPGVATALLGAWYALLIAALLIFGAAPEQTIRYIDL